MNSKVLEVAWKDSLEYINLDNLEAQVAAFRKSAIAIAICTRETWNDGTTCLYIPELQSYHHNDGGEIDVFSLVYKDRGLFKDGTEGEGELGVAHYRLDNAKWTCEWRATESSRPYNPKCKLQVTTLKRTYSSANKPQRDETFRKMILRVDGNKCVLTGESQYEALQAAHIHGVGDGGWETPDNGITLRSDIHALYDAGLFLINTNGRIEAQGKLSSYYMDILNAAVLEETILSRVRGSLLQRNAGKLDGNRTPQ